MNANPITDWRERHDPNGDGYMYRETPEWLIQVAKFIRSTYCSQYGYDHSGSELERIVIETITKAGRA